MLGVGVCRWSRLSPASHIRGLCIAPAGVAPTLETVSGLAGPVPIPPRLPAHPQVKIYAEHVQSYCRFHDGFWARNNARFDQEMQEYLACAPSAGSSVNPEHLSHFYRAYMQRHASEFSLYHRASWRWSFAMLLEEYRLIASQALARLLGRLPRRRPLFFSRPAITNTV